MRNTEMVIIIFFLGGGGGGGGGGRVICKLPKLSNFKLAVNCRTKLRNTHWPDKSLTIVEDKPWK